jgi:hypothetical protein
MSGSFSVAASSLVDHMPEVGTRLNYMRPCVCWALDFIASKVRPEKISKNMS